MNETQRQAYLRVMGIQSYFPRVPVSAAKPSPEYILEIPPLPASAKTSGKQPAVKAVAKPHSPAALKVSNDQSPLTGRTAALVDSGLAAAPTTVPATIPPAVPSTVVAAVAGNHLRFRLQYFRISSVLSVIDEVPYQQQLKASDALKTLLLAILHALGENPEAGALKAESFEWPLESGIAEKSDSAVAAQKALSGYITRCKHRDGFQHLLVFSAQLPALLLDDAAGDGTSPGRIDQFSASGNYHLTVTHSLQSLLAHPILKRETWAHLQPLRQRLAGLQN